MASATVAVPKKLHLLLKNIPPRKETTKSLILDYCLWKATSSRLQQGRLGSQQPPFINQDTIVDGILSSIRHEDDFTGTRPDLSPTLQARLYLCQLTTIVFGRFDDTQPSDVAFGGVPISTTFSSSHHHPIVPAPKLYEKYEILYSIPVNPRACRRHQNIGCHFCVQRKGETPPGLLDAIPVFLKVAAYLLRADHTSYDHLINSLYPLLLSLMTQAAIEAYFCDGHTTLSSLLEIFSYGDIDPSEHYDDMEFEDDDDNSPDDFLLWEETNTVREFRQAKKILFHHFLTSDYDNLATLMKSLAQQYSLIPFHEEMLNFCQYALDMMEKPALATCNSPLVPDINVKDI